MRQAQFGGRVDTSVSECRIEATGVQENSGYKISLRRGGLDTLRYATTMII